MPTLTAARGLVTLPSELTRSDGALVVADNVVIDEDNVIQPRRGFSDYSSIPNDVLAKQLLDYKNRIIKHYANKLAFDNGSGVFTEFNGNYTEVIENLRIKYLEANGNLYFTTNEGVKKLSAESASDFTNTSGLIEKSGMVKAVDVEVTLKPSFGGFLPPQSKVAYRVLWGKRDRNNNVILGVPSARFVLTNLAENISIQQQSRVVFTAYASITAAQYFLLSGLETDYVVWFDTTGSTPAPADANTINKTLIKVPFNSIASNAAAAIAVGSAISSNSGDFEIFVDGTEVLIKVNNPGKTTNISQGTVNAAHATVETLIEGADESGIFANSSLNFTVPAEIDSEDYFYQIYRSGFVTAIDQISLDDIDPGDEMNLVFEAQVTQAQITSGIVTLEDVTPDSFRQSGTFLYTNPVTGQGILQANERPPLCQDIALFRNSTFYANTTNLSRKQVSLLGITGFISGTTKLVVSNDKTFREYTFVGEKEIIDIQVLQKSLTVGNSYITLNSPSNTRGYYLWFNKGTISHSFNSTSAVNDGTDTITVTAHGYANLDQVTFAGTLPSPLIAGTKYFIRNRTANTFQLSSTPTGSIIDLTGVVGTATVTHTPEDPQVADRIAITVNLFLEADTLIGSKQALIDSLIENFDFDAEDFSSDIVRLTAENNGIMDDPTNSTIASGWNTTIVQQGDGEDTISQFVLLSGLISAAQSIDETARSLIRVINRDINSPVNAYYLSGPDDLPGKILLENKDIASGQFYVSINDNTLTENFNPNINSYVTLNSINETTKIFTTVTPHNFVAGEQVYIHDNPAGLPVEFGGLYTINTVPSATEFTLTVDVTIDQPGPIGGIVFFPDFKSDIERYGNRIYFSKINQPEAVPIVNYLEVGPKDQPIERIVALRDSLFVLKSQGIYVITGASAPNFNVRLLDGTVSIIAPDTATALNNEIFMLANEGIVTVTETGVSLVSRNIENKVREVTNSKFNFKYTSFGLAYDADRSYFLWLPTRTSDTVATQCYRFNTFTRTWTRWTITNTCGVINPGDVKMYLGSGNRPVIEQERKLFERQDYSDRNFTRIFNADAYIDTNTFELNSVVGVVAGDVLVQEQYLTIAKFNRLLKKLDTDSGPDFNDYFNTLNCKIGDNLSVKLTDLIIKLNNDINLAGTFTASSGFNTLIALRDDYNILIAELNQPSSGTALKDYKTLTDLIIYETKVMSVNSPLNQVTVLNDTWFIEGDFQVYKAVESIVQYAPQHFGSPDVLKQISEGSVIFDQNNFYGGILSYSSDRNQGFVDIPFNFKGPGFWVSYKWADVVWGGGGNDVPMRTYIPQSSQRCRYLNVKFTHKSARDTYRLLGISLEPRPLSTRGYR